MFVEEYERLDFDHNNYFIDSRGFNVVYCDGSSIGNSTKKPCYSGVGTFWGPGRDTSTESQSPYPHENTSQAAECRAVQLASR